MFNTVVVDHPLIQHKLTLIRDKNTGAKEFRELLRELGILLAYEATKNLPTEIVTIDTPLTKTRARVLGGKKIAVISILRAGLGMVEGLVDLVPAAKIGHLGLYRDPTSLKPVEYYCKLPADLDQRTVLLVDPMLATGGSASAALSILKENGARDISLLVLLASPEGLQLVHREHPEVLIITAAIDEKLDDHGYIIPGLGDAGDRLYGTK